VNVILLAYLIFNIAQLKSDIFYLSNKNNDTCIFVCFFFNTIVGDVSRIQVSKKLKEKLFAKKALLAVLPPGESRQHGRGKEKSQAGRPHSCKAHTGPSAHLARVAACCCHRSAVILGFFKKLLLSNSQHNSYLVYLGSSLALLHC
jgi:hypothetical protein